MTQISRKILFVDDDSMLLEGIQRRLRRKFDLATAAGGEAGLAMLRAQGPFAVVVSDYNMPGMDGVEFLRQVRAHAPQTVLVMLTGRAELNVAVAALHEGHIYRFLNKPCPAEALDTTLNDALEQYRLIMSEQILRAELNQANEELRLLNENLERLVARRTAVIQGLYRLVSDLNGLDSVDEVVSAIVASAAAMLDSRRVVLLLPDAARQHLRIGAAVGIAPADQARLRVPVGMPIAGQVYQDAESLVANRFEELSHLPEPGELSELLGVPAAYTPLVTSEGVVGVLAVAGPAGADGYDPESLAALRAIAEAAAIALLNQIRREERDDARDAAILALARLAEHRDPDTGAHLERVQRYCRLLCEGLARMPRYAGVITRGFIEDIVRSSPLHDIGKVGVPDHILLKPGELTAEEFEIMKQHSRIGGDTIRPLVEQGRRQSFLQMGMEIAYYHHEKYDGSGYPEGLAGKAIPLPARILAVADVYDALTSQRVYKSAMSHAKAFDIITGNSGTHFDPDVVEAFVRQAGEFERLSMTPGQPADKTRDYETESLSACTAGALDG